MHLFLVSYFWLQGSFCTTLALFQVTSHIRKIFFLYNWNFYKYISHWSVDYHRLYIQTLVDNARHFLAGFALIWIAKKHNLCMQCSYKKELCLSSSFKTGVHYYQCKNSTVLAFVPGLQNGFNLLPRWIFFLYMLTQASI